MPTTTMKLTAQQHEQCGRALFNTVWTLLDQPNRSMDDDDLMVHTVHAMMLHWLQVGTPVNFARGEWQLSRVYAVLGRTEGAMRHAERCLAICQEDGIVGFDLAFAYEALARAHAVAGNTAQTSRFLILAEQAGRDIAEHDDRKILFDDLQTIRFSPDKKCSLEFFAEADRAHGDGDSGSGK